MTDEEMRAAAARLVEDWPPLTDAQKDRLRLALRPERPVVARMPKRRRKTTAEAA